MASIRDTHNMDVNNNVYIISLDAVDFNYLPITHKFPDGKMMPLWSKQNLNMRNNDYCEFVINSVHSEEQNDDESDKEIDYTTCYICDIDVPSPFLKQHYDSVKHKTYLKITNAALERVKKSINTINNKEVSRNSPLYFCPVCVIAVNSKEKKSHNKSFSHKNAVAIEKFLQDFSSLYTKDEENAESSDSDDSEAKSEIGNAIDSTNKRHVKSVDPTPKTNGVKNRVDSESNRKHQEKSNKKPNGRTREINGVKKHQIEKIDALERDAARNFKELNGNFDTDTLVNTKSNKSKDSKEINQIMIDDDDEINSNYSFADSDETANGIHLESTRRPHHHLESTLFHTYCRICKININGSDDNHILDLNHEINYEKFLDENAIYKKDSKLMECKICNVSFLCEDEIEHSDQIRHISNYERYKKRNCH